MGSEKLSWRATGAFPSLVNSNENASKRGATTSGRMVEAWIVTLLVNVLPLRSETLLPARVRNVVVFERPSPPSSLS